MRKLLLAVALVLGFATSCFALDIKYSEEWDIKDNMSFTYKAGSSNALGGAGVFIGTIGEIKTDAGKKLVGLGGFNFTLSEASKTNIGFTPLTFFSDIIQVSIGIDPSNFQVDNFDSYMLTIGISGTGLISQFMK